MLILNICFFIFTFLSEYLFNVGQTKLLGDKRSFGDIEDDEEDIFGSKKVMSLKFLCFLWSRCCIQLRRPEHALIEIVVVFCNTVLEFKMVVM